MKQLLFALVLALGLAAPAAAADADIIGNWIGSVSTDRGQMDIGLSLASEKGKLAGTLKTGHGDWQVTSATEKDGVWTVAFKGDDNEGTITGRITGAEFKGEWKSKMSNGTFELSRSKKK